MLKLSLTNFRCWEEKEISIPDVGICLINGKSGKGKSTILNSIVYCITGKLKNISTINKKYTKVKLSIDDMTITRTRGPNRLIVEKEGKIYEDDQAQAIIDNVFGSEFSNTSYIDQDNINSFVFLSPSEKIEFLEKLILSQHNIETIKDNIKDAITKTKLDHVSEESKITTLSSLLKNMSYIPEQELLILGLKTTPSNIEKLLEKVKNNLEISTKNTKTLVSKIKSLEDEKLVFAKTIEKKKILEFRLQELTTQKDLFSISNDYLPSLLKQKEIYIANKEFVKQKECKDKHDALFEKNKKEIDVLQTLLLSLSKPDKKRIATLEKAKDVLSTLLRLEKGLEIDYDEQLILDQSSLIEKYKKELSDREKSYKCPSCSKHLKIHNNELVQLHTETNIKSKEELIEFIQRSEQTVNTHKKNKILYEKREKEYNELFDFFETLQVENDSEEIDKELAILEKNNTIYEDTLKKIQAIENDRLLSQYKKDLEKYHDLKPIEEQTDIKTEEEYLSLLDTIAKTSEEISQYKSTLSKIQTVEKEIENLPPLPDKDYQSLLTSEREKLQTYEEKTVNYKSYIDQLTDWNRIHKDNVKYKEIETSISSSQTQKENLSVRMRCLVKLKEHVKNAERKCITDFIDSLNDHASLYIEQFFPDEDIKVELKTIQESKTGKEKISLNFEINYKQMVGDLSYLSGGEKDRVNLAFTLAFSELVNNRVLLLDECISSLDAETTNVVLENLKEKYKGKLVLLVSHQANIGFFDSVMNI
jgi:DNA repair exonuclease SbcCD ATPase subunit